MSESKKESVDVRPQEDERQGRRNFVGAAMGMGGLMAMAAPGMVSAQSSSSEEGFNDISLLDRMRILEEVSRYSWAFDSGDLDGYLARFWEDGKLHHPLRDGSPGTFEGHEGITGFVSGGFENRGEQTWGHQHQMGSFLLERENEQDVKLKAYCIVFRHEFQRQYWNTGPSFRMGTWHALYRKRNDEWKIQDLDVRMWTDTALGDTGKDLAEEWEPGRPGTRASR